MTSIKIRKANQMAKNDNKLVLCSWIGGKSRLVDKYIDILCEYPHDTYVEVCGGMGSVLLNKPRVEHEVYNDVDIHNALLFKGLADPEASMKILNMLEGRQYCKDLFDEANEIYNKYFYEFVRYDQETYTVNKDKIIAWLEEPWDKDHPKLSQKEAKKSKSNKKCITFDNTPQGVAERAVRTVPKNRIKKKRSERISKDIWKCIKLNFGKRKRKYLNLNIKQVTTIKKIKKTTKWLLRDGFTFDKLVGDELAEIAFAIYCKRKMGWAGQFVRKYKQPSDADCIAFERSVAKLPEIIARLRGVKVTNEDMMKLIDRYSTNPNAVIYADPPYMPDVTDKESFDRSIEAYKAYGNEDFDLTPYLLNLLFAPNNRKVKRYHIKKVITIMRKRIKIILKRLKGIRIRRSIKGTNTRAKIVKKRIKGLNLRFELVVVPRTIYAYIAMSNYRNGMIDEALMNSCYGYKWERRLVGRVAVQTAVTDVKPFADEFLYIHHPDW